MEVRARYNELHLKGLLMKQLLALAAGALAAGALVVVVGETQARSAGPAVVSISFNALRRSRIRASARLSSWTRCGRSARARWAPNKRNWKTLVRQLARADTPAADRDRLSQDEARRRTELQQLTSQAQSDFQSAQQRLQTELRTQLTPILAEIAKRSGVDVVLNSDTAIAWAAPGTDATNEVLQRLNAAPQ